VAGSPFDLVDIGGLSYCFFDPKQVACEVSGILPDFANGRTF
jgi:hypothetical protein